VCDYKPHKKGKELAIITAVGDILEYSREVATFTAYLTTFKILINSTVDDSSISRVVEILQPFAKPTVLLDYSLEVR
jgi:hypothetical protein